MLKSSGATLQLLCDGCLVLARSGKKKKVQEFVETHPLKHAPTHTHTADLLTGTEMTASKFPSRGSQALACPCCQTRSGLKALFCNTSPAWLPVDTAGQAAACTGLLMWCQSPGVSHTSHPSGFEEGGGQGVRDERCSLVK